MTSLLLFLAVVGTGLLGALLSALWIGPKWKFRRALSAAALQSAIITLLSFTLLYSLPGFFDESATGRSFATQFSNWISDPADRKNSLNDSFLLLDNSENTVLIPSPGSDLDEQRFIPITNRRILAEALRYFHSHEKEYDLVVLDITFEHSSPDDSLLREAILQLANQDRILLAKGAETNCDALRFDDALLADVTEYTQNNLYAWHELEPLDDPSLPYRLYQRTTGATPQATRAGLIRETLADGSDHYIRSGFFPRLNAMTDSQLEKNAPDNISTFNLGFITSIYGQMTLEAWRGELPSDARPLVMIGDFPSAESHTPSSDVHATLDGQMTGPLILLNLYFELCQQAHVFNLRHLLLVFLFLWLIGVLLYWIAYYPSTPEKEHTHLTNQLLQNVGNELKLAGLNLLKLSLLILGFWLTDQISPAQLNLAPVFIYLVSVVEFMRPITTKTT